MSHGNPRENGSIQTNSMFDTTRTATSKRENGSIRTNSMFDTRRTATSKREDGPYFDIINNSILTNSTNDNSMFDSTRTTTSKREDGSIQTNSMFDTTKTTTSKSFSNLSITEQSNGNQLPQVQNEIDMNSLSLRAAEELYKRPISVEISNFFAKSLINLEIQEQLKHLSGSVSGQTLSDTDAAIGIADAAYLLRRLGLSQTQIEKAGQLAHSGALLLLQAEMLLSSGSKVQSDMLYREGKELLGKSKTELNAFFSSHGSVVGS